MSSFEDKARGAGNETTGNVKQVVGQATGNDKLEAEGKAQELKGEAQSALGKAKEAIGNALENAADAIKGSGK
ncbi:CsbD family protein [bacterium]|nr:MAG: CsbD family protein [bacterium]